MAVAEFNEQLKKMKADRGKEAEKETLQQVFLSPPPPLPLSLSPSLPLSLPPSLSVSRYLSLSPAL